MLSVAGVRGGQHRLAASNHLEMPPAVVVAASSERKPLADTNGSVGDRGGVGKLRPPAGTTGSVNGTFSQGAHRHAQRVDMHCLCVASA